MYFYNVNNNIKQMIISPHGKQSVAEFTQHKTTWTKPGLNLYKPHEKSGSVVQHIEHTVFTKWK